MRRKEAAPPAGGRQNLRKPMPKDTRYKGESYPASDTVGRYREHMEKQRAVARQREDRREWQGAVPAADATADGGEYACQKT